MSELLSQRPTTSANSEREDEHEQQQQQQGTSSTALEQTATAAVPTLCDDIVYQIAEHMLATMPSKASGNHPWMSTDYGIDFMEPTSVYTQFMLHNRQNFIVLLALFARMKRLRLSSWSGRDQFCLYKTKEPEPYYGCRFTGFVDETIEQEHDRPPQHQRRLGTQAYAGPFFGPYRIPVGLLCQLLDQQRLRVSHVEISPGFLENKQPDVERWIGKRNVDAFAGIFLDRKDTVPSDVLLVIEQLYVCARAYELENKWAPLLMLNAAHIKMRINCHSNRGYPHVFECTDSGLSENQLLIADATREIRIEMTPKIWELCIDVEKQEEEDATLNRLKRFVHFTIACCPNLRKLKFDFRKFVNSFDGEGLELVECMDRLHRLVVRLYIELLVLLEAGHAELCVCIVFQERVILKDFQQLVHNDHTAELRELSIPYTEWETIERNREERRIEAVDRRGRKHVCCLQLQCFYRRSVLDDDEDDHIDDDQDDNSSDGYDDSGDDEDYDDDDEMMEVHEEDIAAMMEL